MSEEIGRRQPPDGGRERTKNLVAGAPVSWGVIEIPDWGYQMPAGRVLEEAASLGLEAMEAGPEGFLPDDPAEVRAKLAEHGLRLVGGFVPAVLHRPEVLEEELSFVERRARFFEAAGAGVIVLAASTGSESYEEVVELDEGGWRALFEGLSRVEEIAERHGLAVALHPHYGTVIETDEALWRFLGGSETGLCLDTGHLVIGGSDPVEVARRSARRVELVHLKDVDRSLAERVANRELSFKEAAGRGMFRPLGEGDVDVAGVVRHLEEGGYPGWYVLEQDTVVDCEPEVGDGPIENVRKSLSYLQGELEKEAGK
ncbi:sugar phosphate isomerase/epimerase family protein [Rubrobacter naiadicus]|uniref:sugar phosphate isomerase/epimerase family protein n=1 Tax=Rubrobacter naiadicus TaxID=1392641 RepID=UPI00235F94C4|nr:sugar phosphate isomerase/epimerase [Rubrobacter naiadicus]